MQGSVGWEEVMGESGGQVGGEIYQVVLAGRW